VAKYKDYKIFKNSSAASVGGKTGSLRLQAKDGNYYQLKKSILNAGLLRRIKAGFTDRENFGEVISSTIGRALTDSNNNIELVPEVSLVYDQDKKQVLVASRYLKGEGDVKDLDKYAKEDRGVQTKRKIVKVTAKAENEGEFFIGNDEQIKKDICKGIAVSAVVGDHDVNPANFVVVRHDSKDRVARIDFGHAFNDLLRYGRVAGGGLINKENQILDFLNRRAVAHFNPNRQRSKLWKFYKGLIPSLEMAEALREVADSTGLQDGISQAKSSFDDLIINLLEDPKANSEVINHIKKSLIAINNNISSSKIRTDLHPQVLVDLVFKNIEIFCRENQEKMKDVAVLVEMQANIDKMILDKSQITPEMIGKIKLQYEDLLTKDGIKLSIGDGIKWVKTDEKISPFKGNIENYIKHRSKILHCDPSLSKDFASKDQGTKPVTTAIRLFLAELVTGFFQAIVDKVKELFIFTGIINADSSAKSKIVQVDNQGLNDLTRSQAQMSLTQSRAAEILDGTEIPKPIISEKQAKAPPAKKKQVSQSLD
jgi:hypothetical protein